MNATAASRITPAAVPTLYERLGGPAGEAGTKKDVLAILYSLKAEIIRV